MIDSNNTEYEITQENELAYILSRFNQDYVYITIEESLKNRLKPYSFTMPNIIMALKYEFEAAKINYNNIPEISILEKDNYIRIIEILCGRYNLTCMPMEEDLDLFSIAYHLYDFLVCNFQKNIVNFFTNFILSEKDALYKMLELNNIKKNKDTSTLYVKKIFKDYKLGIISANLEYVVQSICSSID